MAKRSKEAEAPDATGRGALGQRWKEEIANAKKYLEPWHKSARDILKRYKDQRSKDDTERRLNLFTAEVLTKRAVLYGKTPQVNCSRRWKDAGDDVARVAAEMRSRHLNDDITSGEDGYKRALGYVLDDRFTVGMGQARVRLEVENEPIPPEELQAAKQEGQAPEEEEGKPPPERVAYKCAKVDYIFWEDFLWSPCRYWEVVRWVDFQSEMSRKMLIKRFGSRGASIPLDAQKASEDEKKREQEPPWARAKIHEIWDKDERQTLWVTEQGVVLDVRKDMLQLKGFFPCPRPLFSLTSTDEMIPRPDFSIAEDLYRDIDELSTRMHLLRSALRVVGCYDASNPDLGDLLQNTSENQMLPVKNWAMFGEKGGLKGAVDYFPVQEVAATLVALSGEFESLKTRLYEVTGMSDILRGQGASQAVTATEQRIKANFGSARLQAVQDEFAEFATELQAIKAEVISKHFDAEEIVRCSNMLNTPDRDLAMQAAMLLKDEHEQFRVKVQPEALALSDFAALKEERLEVVQVVAQFISGITPLLQLMPSALPALLEILKWLVSALRGSSEIEGVLDKAMAMAQQAAQQPQGAQQPDPKMMTQQLKGQQDMQKIDKELQADLVRAQAEVQADAQREQNQAMWNTREAVAKHQLAQQARAMEPQRGQPGGTP